MSRRPEPVEALVPPHSDEAEQAVLGALLLDNSALNDLADLEPEHFYRAEYGQTFSRIKALVLAAKPADVITVSESGVLDLGAVNDLAMSVPSASNVLHYAEIVMDRWRERRLLLVGGEIAKSAVAQGDVAEKLDQAMASITSIAERRARADAVGIDQALTDFLDRFEREAAGETEVISTGLRDLDRAMNGGGRRGELMVVGARPKMGKTALTLQMVRNISTAHRVLFCSQEMPVYELMARNIAALGQINVAHMRNPSAMPEECWGRIAEAVDEMRGRLLEQDDQRALTLLDVRRKVMAAKRRGGLDVVVVDYLQLMAGAGGDNRNQELDRISNGLKALAGEFDVWVVVLSQMTREADKRHGPPVMTDLRDSGAIEAAADVIALLYREFAHPLGEKSDDWKHHAQLELVQRNGSPGTVSLWFSGEFQQFKDWSGPPPSRLKAGRTGGGGGGRARDSGLG